MASIFNRIKNCNREASSVDKKLPGELQQSIGNIGLEPRNLAFASGFVTLHERIKNLASKKSRLNEDEEDELRWEYVPQKQRPQYATLQELFSSRSKSIGVQWHHQQQLQPKKPKIPIMKLNKEDWNVKCWEERLSKRRHESSKLATKKLEPNWPVKPERQVEVFQGRIEDVAVKLEKVREGAPQDETLYQLSLNKGGTCVGKTSKKGSHEWTDLLKSELENRTHSPAKLAAKQQATTKTSQTKSPLGRPIRRIFEEEDDDD